MDTFSAQIASAEWWNAFGFWVLVLGLAGELFVLVIPRYRRNLEKALSAGFAVLAMAGCTIVYTADGKISNLVSREASDRAAQIAADNRIAQTAASYAGGLGIKVDNLAQFVANKSLEVDTTIASMNGVVQRASGKLSAVQPHQAQRHLSKDQQQALIAAISPFKGQSVAAVSMFGDDDGKTYRQDFVDAFSKAKWSINGRVGEIDLQPAQVGVAVAMNKEWVEAGNKLPDSLGPLITTLASLKIIESKNLLLISKLPPGQIFVVVGNRPQS